MKIVDIFLQDNKDKFLNKVVKIPKGYEWYFGIIVEDREKYAIIKDRCDLIKVKSNNQIQLLKIFGIYKEDKAFTLLLFAFTPFSNDIQKTINSITKYLKCDNFTINYVKKFDELIKDSWGVQQYHYLADEDSDFPVAYDLKTI